MFTNKTGPMTREHVAFFFSMNTPYMYRVVYNPARSYTGEHVAFCCITPHVPVVIDIKQALGMCSG